MTLDEKINQRRIAMAMRNKQATGIVCDYTTYRQLCSMKQAFFPMEHRCSSSITVDEFGDTYMGLDVAITKKPNTLIVY